MVKIVGRLVGKLGIWEVSVDKYMRLPIGAR